MSDATNTTDLSKLDDFFAENELEWRVQSAGAKESKPWARVLVYVDNRAIMRRLDKVCGKEKWRNEYTTGPGGGVLCGISIKVDGEWVTKWDGAENTQIESVKGGLSDSMKRAAVQWGIGRYLYYIPETFANIDPNGKYYQSKDKEGKYPAFKWNPPSMPGKLLPGAEPKPHASDQPLSAVPA